MDINAASSPPIPIPRTPRPPLPSLRARESTTERAASAAESTASIIPRLRHVCPGPYYACEPCCSLGWAIGARTESKNKEGGALIPISNSLPGLFLAPPPAPDGAAKVSPSVIDTHTTSHSPVPGRKSFFSFPPEIRNEIYSYLTQYPTCQELYAGYNRRIDQYYARKRNDPDTTEEFPEYVRGYRTPNILLLCRAITAECMPMLKRGTFVVDQLPPWKPKADRPMQLTEFISERTLQSLRNIEIYVQLGIGSYGGGWVWYPVFHEIFSILMRDNSFFHFGVAFVMRNQHHGYMFDLERAFLDKMGLELQHLRDRNPRWWVDSVTRVQVGWWTIKGDKAIPGIKHPHTKVITYGHAAINGQHSYRAPHPHPNFSRNEWVGDVEKLFEGGGVLEFL